MDSIDRVSGMILGRILAQYIYAKNAGDVSDPYALMGKVMPEFWSMMRHVSGGEDSHPPSTPTSSSSSSPPTPASLEAFSAACLLSLEPDYQRWLDRVGSGLEGIGLLVYCGYLRKIMSGLPTPSEDPIPGLDYLPNHKTFTGIPSEVGIVKMLAMLPIVLASSGKTFEELLERIWQLGDRLPLPALLHKKYIMGALGACLGAKLGAIKLVEDPDIKDIATKLLVQNKIPLEKLTLMLVKKLESAPNPPPFLDLIQQVLERYPDLLARLTPEPEPDIWSSLELKLRPNQVEWAAKALSILGNMPGYLDTSTMGRGKTLIAIWVALKLNLPLVVFCPLSAISVWRKHASNYGVKVIYAGSYASVRGSKVNTPPHGYLSRRDYVATYGDYQKDEIEFKPTKKYLDLLKEGILLILDEIQDLKNASGQQRGAKALIRALATSGTRSRYACLTGTPFDRIEHAFHFLTLTGFIQADILYRYKADKSVELLGMQELIDKANQVNPVECQRILAMTPRYQLGHVVCKPKHAYDFYPPHFTHHRYMGGYKYADDPCYQAAYNFFRYMIRPMIGGYIPRPVGVESMRDIKNGFYNMTRADENRIQEILNKFRKMMFEKTGRGVRIPTVKLLEAIEHAKVNTFVRVAISILEANPRFKVIIMVNYYLALNEIVQKLKAYNPLLLVGSTKQAQRARVEGLFNTDPKHRLVIGITKVGGVSISLHDTDGDYPRFLLLSASWHLLSDYQATGRIDRDGVKSRATTRIIYGKNTGREEAFLLSYAASKSEILGTTLDPQQLEEIILPKDYPIEIEPDDMPDLGLVPSQPIVGSSKTDYGSDLVDGGL